MKTWMFRSIVGGLMTASLMFGAVSPSAVTAYAKCHVHKHQACGTPITDRAISLRRH